MLRTILLMRHAQAVDGHSTLRDFDRSLTDEGRLMAQQTGSCLNSLGVGINRIIASSALRTKQTAATVALECCPTATLSLHDELYNGSAESFASAIWKESSEDEATVLVVGHNPGIAGLMCHWAQQNLSVPPATLTIYQRDAPDWLHFRLHRTPFPGMVCVLQNGCILQQDAAFGNPASPKA